MLQSIYAPFFTVGLSFLSPSALSASVFTAILSVSSSISFPFSSSIQFVLSPSLTWCTVALPPTCHPNPGLLALISLLHLPVTLLSSPLDVVCVFSIVPDCFKPHLPVCHRTNGGNKAMKCYSGTDTVCIQQLVQPTVHTSYTTVQSP